MVLRLQISKNINFGNKIKIENSEQSRYAKLYYYNYPILYFFENVFSKINLSIDYLTNIIEKEISY